MSQSSGITLGRRMAATVMAVAVMASAMPAQAQYRHGGYHGRPAPHYDNRRDRRGHSGNNGGALIAGALLGVIAGTAISNANRPPPDVVYRTAPPPPPPGVVYYDDNGY